MKRKIVSLILACAMLTQVSAFATSSLDTFKTTYPDYETIIDGTDAIETSVVASVRKHSTDDESVYDNFGQHQVSGNALVGSASESFDFKMLLQMANVKDFFGKAYAIASSSPLNSIPVTGEFTVDVTYDDGLEFNAPTTSDVVLHNVNSVGTVRPADIFAVTNVVNAPNKTTVTFKVINGITVGDLNSNPQYFDDLFVEFENVKVNADYYKKALEVSSQLVPVSKTNISFLEINYESTKDSAFVYVSTGGSSNPGTSSYTPIVQPPKEDEKNVTITDETTGETTSTNVEPDEDGSLQIPVIFENTPSGKIKITPPETQEEKPGFVPNGYSTVPFSGGDEDYDGTVEVTEEDIVGGTVTLYPRYVNVTVPENLVNENETENNTEHALYIVGYPDGEIKPKGNITREEVTTAFYRLLNATYKESIETTSHNFPDVNADRWSNKAIATMAKGGFIVGDKTGAFNPGSPITRAEFAVIASKFAPTTATPAENYFNDISNHWAKNAILIVAGQYWVSGYGNGEFKPDAYITRAEAMSIINRMLVRYADHDTAYAKQWPDVKKSDWYYDAVVEATTHNYYARLENGWSEYWKEDAETDTQKAVDEIMIDTYGEN